MESTTAPPVVRVRRAPACEPPYDDERHPETWLLPQPQLDLASLTSRRRSAPTPAAATPPATTKPAPESRGVSPVRAAVVRFLRAWLEILNGYRPLAHVRALANPLDAAQVVNATTDAVRRFSRLGRPKAAHGPLLRIGRVRLCQPRPDVVEVAAVLLGHGRAWASALRLQHLNGRWLCTSTTVLWPRHALSRRCST